MGPILVAWGLFKDLIQWCHEEIRESASNLMRDLRSLRALWNWLIFALYTWACVWGVLYYPEIAIKTVIVTTGTLVGAIFTNYVWASYMEKKNINGAKTPPKTPAASAPKGGDGDG